MTSSCFPLHPHPYARYAYPPLASGRGPFPAMPPAYVVPHIAYTILAPPCGHTYSLYYSCSSLWAHAGLVVVVVDAVVDTVEGTFHGLSLLIRHAMYTRCIRYVYTAYLHMRRCAD